MSTAVRITGLVASSRKYSDTRGQAVHELLLTQGPDSLPVLVRRCFGGTATGHFVALGLERDHRPGQHATATGRAIHFDRRRHLLVLEAPDHLEPHVVEQPLDAVPA